MANTEESFEISVKGDVSGEMFIGKFSAKKRLSIRDELNKDRLRREFLGPNAQSATESAQINAIILSELKVSLGDRPKWWTDSQEGLDLVDENVLTSLYEECMRIREEAIEALTSKAKEAREELKKIIKEND